MNNTTNVSSDHRTRLARRRARLNHEAMMSTAVPLLLFGVSASSKTSKVDVLFGSPDSLTFITVRLMRKNEPIFAKFWRPNADLSRVVDHCDFIGLEQLPEFRDSIIAAKQYLQATLCKHAESFIPAVDPIDQYGLIPCEYARVSQLFYFLYPTVECKALNEVAPSPLSTNSDEAVTAVPIETKMETAPSQLLSLSSSDEVLANHASPFDYE